MTSTDGYATPTLTARPAPPRPQQFLASHLGGTPDDWKIRALSRSRLNSAVYLASNTKRGLRALLKLTSPPTGNPTLDAHGAAAQALALTEAAAALQTSPDCRVPAVLACDAQSGLLALEWLDAPGATQAIKAAPDANAARRSAARCGQWLAVYHAAAASALFDPANRLVHLQDATAGTTPPPRLQALVRTLRDTAAKQEVATPVGWVHGDFKTDNLLLGPHTAWGIDLAPRKRHHVLPDMAMHLNHAALTGMDARWPGLEAAFMEGYANAGLRVPQAALDWLRVQMLTERLLESLQAPIGRRWARWAQHRRMLRLAEELATRLA